MNKRAIGSILMILGTSIGAGMLALPVVSAQENFLASSLCLILAWLVMTIGALSILEVNLWLKPETNFVSMARFTLGRAGQVVTWVIYLLLLYSLICAYLSGLSDLLQALLANFNLAIPRWGASIICLALFGWVVYRGIDSIDLVNRGLMSTKIIIFIVLTSLVVSRIDLASVFVGDYRVHIATLMVMLTSFGFATIIPSLRAYLDSDRRVLIKTVLVGSLLPLILYLIWIFVIQGILPRAGAHGLVQMALSDNTNSDLIREISVVVNSKVISHLANFFISICAMTSFLGVSLCLVDFMADGMARSKQGRSGILVFAAAYLPPLAIVLFWPGVFIHALAYAGLCCLLLLIVIPLLMLLSGRYCLKQAHQAILPGGKWLIGLVLLAVLVLVAFQL